MIEKLKDFDADFVLFFNGLHTAFLDSFFYDQQNVCLDTVIFIAALLCI
ncbi:MAG: hypothetical protein IPP27_08350 [Bacteroidetes bacterium]|nr:hypothetical protein [Bacteroidota bacterium]